MVFILQIDSIVGKKAIGRLQWDADYYAVVSGPYGNGYTEVGDYTVEVRKVDTSPGSDAYCLGPSGSKVCFFIPLTPLFDTDRSGIGIHPDGNVPGTEGCIGLQDPDYASFWQKWNATKLGDRPTTLSVKKASNAFETFDTPDLKMKQASEAVSALMRSIDEGRAMLGKRAVKVQFGHDGKVRSISVRLES